MSNISYSNVLAAFLACTVYVYLLDIPRQPTCMKLCTGEFYEHILSCAMQQGSYMSGLMLSCLGTAT